MGYTVPNSRNDESINTKRPGKKVPSYFKRWPAIPSGTVRKKRSFPGGLSKDGLVNASGGLIGF
jgi:hypothetical protein